MEKKTRETNEKQEVSQPAPVSSVPSRIRISRNPYVNFLRDYQKRHPKLTYEELLRQTSALWKDMPRQDRVKYIEAAYYETIRRETIAASKRKERAMKSNSDEDPDEGCPRRRKKRCPCPPKRRRRRCPRRRPKCRPCCKRRRRRRRC